MNSVLVITIIGVLLIVASLLLIAFVLMQSAKNSRMSGVVSGGGAETFFGKYKGKAIDKRLNRWTVILASSFAAIVLLLFIIQPGTGRVHYEDPDWNNALAQQTATTSGTSTAKPNPSKPDTTGTPDTTTASPANTTSSTPNTSSAPDTTTAAPAEGN